MIGKENRKKMMAFVSIIVNILLTVPYDNTPS